MLPKGILFDLDDTIIQFECESETVWSEVCGIYYSDCNLSESGLLMQTISKTRKWFWSDPKRNKASRQNLYNARREVVNFALENIGITNLSLAWKIADSYSELREQYIEFFPGAEETLQKIKDNNVKLSLITNGQAEYQRKKIARFNLERYFDSILIEGEIGIGKPDREVYIKAFKSLGLNHDDVWAVGDNLEWEVRGPQELGIYSIWNDYRKKGLPPGSEIIPDRIIHSISELMA